MTQHACLLGDISHFYMSLYVIYTHLHMTPLFVYLVVFRGGGGQRGVFIPLIPPPTQQRGTPNRQATPKTSPSRATARMATMTMLACWS